VTGPSEPKIFIVDDDEGVRDSLATLLKSEGWDVHAFENGREFLEAFDVAERGCLLLDLNMPIMGGREVVEALLARECKIPVIVITSDDNARINSGLLHLGVVKVLQKPLNHEALFEVINQVV